MEWSVGSQQTHQFPDSIVTENFQVVKHRQLLHRNMIVPTDDPTTANVKLMGTPYKFREYPDMDPPTRPKAPMLDENRQEILDSINWTSKL
jgi:crotonobetainyl-CoA:carnitine CoA-transferase CaiB-like acyl-CoA transferase